MYSIFICTNVHSLSLSLSRAPLRLNVVTCVCRIVCVSIPSVVRRHVVFPLQLIKLGVVLLKNHTYVGGFCVTVVLLAVLFVVLGVAGGPLCNAPPGLFYSLFPGMRHDNYMDNCPNDCEIAGKTETIPFVRTTKGPAGDGI